MTGRVVFLLEEPSMRDLLEILLPRLFPHWQPMQHFQCVPHEGKSDLDRSIPRKLKAWKEPGVRFVVVRDNDAADCIDVKRRLARLCSDAGRPDTLVRLVCQELESWYVGDLQALAAAFPGCAVDTPANRKRYDDPDRLRKPSAEMDRLVPMFQKRSGARAMAAQLSADRNRSRSFQVFVEGVARLAR